MRAKSKEYSDMKLFLLLKSQGWQHRHINGLVQDWGISIANAMEILQSCTKPSIYTPFLLINLCAECRIRTSNVPTYPASAIIRSVTGMLHSWHFLISSSSCNFLQDNTQVTKHIDVWMQDSVNSSALAMELPQSCTKQSIYPHGCMKYWGICQMLKTFVGWRGITTNRHNFFLLRNNSTCTKLIRQNIDYIRNTISNGILLHKPYIQCSFILACSSRSYCW